MTNDESAASAGQTTPPTKDGAPRRRLWDLDVDSHGPIVGSCWPVAELRRLTDTLFAGRSSLDDFALHAAVVAQCATRNKVSMRLQRELDRRFADVLRRFAGAATAQQLAALWSGARHGGNVGAALWAALTHAHCDSELHARVHKDLYLLQHECVAALHAEAAARAALRAENLAQSADAQRARLRHARWRSQALAERRALRCEVAELRGRVAALETQIARSSEPAPQRALPTAGREALVQRVAELTRQLSEAQRCAAAARAVRRTPVPVIEAEAEPALSDRQADARAEPPPLSLPLPLPLPPAPAAARLKDTSVLCVGGRIAHVPVYRQLVERGGGRFAHHDGGIEDNAHRLDAQLAAADLVVCQAGCLNHNAYARVKAHCKRSGKPCVYLDKPGAGSFVRALLGAAMPQRDAMPEATA